MKNGALLVFIIFLLFNLGLFAQTSSIDKIETKEDVISLLQKEINSKFTFGYVFTSKDTSYNMKVMQNQFLKIDLDNDGYKDLLLYGKFLAVIMANKNGEYEYHNLDLGSFGYKSYQLLDIGSIAEYENQPSLIVKHHPNYNEYVDFNDTTSTELIYKFGYFIPYNSNPAKAQMRKLNFRTSGCYGSCSVLKITIEESGMAYYEAIKHNKTNGKFKAQLSEFTMEHLSLFMDYLNLATLDSNYNDISTDLPTYRFSIYYQNAMEKHFKDYGQMGPFQLQAVYRYMFKLRRTVGWEPVD
jgi:hypothetical protein